MASVVFGGFSSDKNSARNSGKHRGQEQASGAEGEPDHELESYLAALAPETDAETTDTGRRFGDAQVYQLRLNLVAADQLKQLARDRGTAPLSLIQEWVLERLRHESERIEYERHRSERWDPRHP